MGIVKKDARPAVLNSISRLPSAPPTVPQHRTPPSFFSNEIRPVQARHASRSMCPDPQELSGRQGNPGQEL